MDKDYQFQSKQIRYQDLGKGSVLVLLHGFMENGTMWDPFVEELSNEHRLIIIDLPGHGGSEALESQSMPVLAEMVKEILKKEQIKKCRMIGHSMGGYVALAFSKSFPRLIKGLCLFHSHPFQDKETKRKERLRTVRALESGKKDFIKESLPKYLSPLNQLTMKQEIGHMIEIAEQCSIDGLKKSLLGMAHREERTGRLFWRRKSTYAIIGESDPSVPTEDLMDLCDKWDVDYTLIRNCGHMGYIEAPEESMGGIRTFLENTN